MSPIFQAVITMIFRKTFLSAVLLCGWFVSPALADPTPEEIEFFEKKIRPVLAEHCYKCHSQEAKKVKGKLLLDSRTELLKGGEGGLVVVAGHPEKSRLIEAILYKNVDLQMPPRAKLPDAVIADLTAWVKMGAPWGVERAPRVSGGSDAFDLAKRKREHWAWHPIQNQKPSAVKNQAWPRSDIDRFILARLEEKGLSPAAPADPRTLVRRLYFDLIGLPPSPQELETFLRENGNDQTVTQPALEKLVDRLLDSPHFGERWGRHWLDLVRYAESRGHEFDYTLPNAHQYRDYVIRAFNADVPYNQFVAEHIAGDLLPKPRMHPTEKFNESILGTGFWFLGEQIHSPVDICQDRADRQDNMIDVMSKTFLGLTVACARCHDHKFDAISTKDYYALAGYLQSSSYRLARFDTLDHNHEVAKKLAELRQRSQSKVLETLARGFAAKAENLADYLLGAREVLAKTHTREEVVKERQKVKTDILDRWVSYLPMAAKDPKDPLHAWARIAIDPKAYGEKDVAETLAPVIKAWSKQLADSKQALAGVDVIIDYGKFRPKDWIQDGYCFSPVSPGDLKFSTDPARPIQIHERGCAQADPAWIGLKLAAGSENEPGALERMTRAGRTLHTPSFQVKSGRVHFLVKGTGLAYANVEGHVMIVGPLHGEVVMPIKASAGFQWVTQDLTRYKGLRAHVEFTPAPGSDFAIAMVVQGDNPPRGLDQPNADVLQMIQKPNLTLDLLAGHYQALIGQPLRTLGGMDPWMLEAEPQAWHLANWSIQHPELFGNPVEYSTWFERASAAYLADQAKLVSTIKTTSRLAPAMLDGNGVDERVFIRGSYKTAGEVAPRRLLEALVGDTRAAERPSVRSHAERGNEEAGSGRLHLAEQMTDPAVTPFGPRVMVNRVWHHLFGRGIVATVDNFGVLGERPTHPELLDYLADQFVQDGWSMKQLIRRLVLSSTYQMSSRPDEQAKQIDPQNLLLQHMRIRRLEGEAIRDAILQVSGGLDRKMFGRSVPVHLTAFQEGRGRPASGPIDGAGRRSVYLAVRRNFLSPLLLAFDTPSPFSTVGRRTVSNVPAQALILLNDPFVHQQAGKWAKQVLLQEKTESARITTMYQAAFSRAPTEREMAACAEFIEQQSRLVAMNELAVWSDLAHVLFNAKEFIYLN